MTPPSSESRKSSSSSEQRDKPKPLRSRLFRGRFAHSRPTELEDLKYAYAAWRKGSFDLDHFDVPDDTQAHDFVLLLHMHLAGDPASGIRETYQFHHTLLAETPGEGRVPVGMALAYWPDRRVPVLWLAKLLWFPWASDRNKLETVVHFMNALRGDWLILEFARAEDQRFFDHVCRYGVMRRAGTSLGLYEEPAAIYETRRPYKRKAEWPSVQFSAQ